MQTKTKIQSEGLNSEASLALLRFTQGGLPFPSYLREKLTPVQLQTLTEKERRATAAVIDDNGRKQSEIVEEAAIEFVPTEVPRLEIEGSDVIDGLALETTIGTRLPFNFARESFKMMLLAALPERPALPWFHTLHPRQYVILISDTPGAGKGETFRRASQTLIRDGFNIEFILGDTLGSPEYACIKLGGEWKSAKAKAKSGPSLDVSITPPYGRIVHFDEGKKLFQKDAVGHGSERGLLTMFTSLFESNAHSTGSFKNGEAHVAAANVSLMMHFTRAGFDRCFTGSGATRDGFLSRCTIITDRANRVEGDWRRVDSPTIQSLIKSARTRSQPLREDSAATALRQEYMRKLDGLDPAFNSRLPFLFTQDLYVRALFDDGVISADKVERAIAWTDHQYQTRQTLWPFDTGIDRNERMYLNLRAAYQKHGRLTHAQAMRLCNVNREGSGGAEMYHRAHRAMLVTGEIENAGVNHKRRAIFAWTS